MNTYLVLLLSIFALWLFYSRRKRRHHKGGDGGSGNDSGTTENINSNEQGHSRHCNTDSSNDGCGDGGSGGD